MNDMAQLVPALPDSIFRAYDIRGVVGKTLHAETAYWIGRAIGAQTLAQGEPQISVGRDGRLSGPMLVEQLIKGLVEACRAWSGVLRQGEFGAQARVEDLGLKSVHVTY